MGGASGAAARGHRFVPRLGQQLDQAEHQDAGGVGAGLVRRERHGGPRSRLPARAAWPLSGNNFDIILDPFPHTILS